MRKYSNRNRFSNDQNITGPVPSAFLVSWRLTPVWLQFQKNLYYEANNHSDLGTPGPCKKRVSFLA